MILENGASHHLYAMIYSDSMDRDFKVYVGISKNIPSRIGYHRRANKKIHNFYLLKRNCQLAQMDEHLMTITLALEIGANYVEGAEFVSPWSSRSQDSPDNDSLKTSISDSYVQGSLKMEKLEKELDRLEKDESFRMSNEVSEDSNSSLLSLKKNVENHQENSQDFKQALGSSPSKFLSQYKEPSELFTAENPSKYNLLKTSMHMINGCFRCGFEGHFSHQCFSKKFRLDWWKQKFDLDHCRKLLAYILNEYSKDPFLEKSKGAPIFFTPIAQKKNRVMMDRSEFKLEMTEKILQTIYPIN